MAPTEDPTLSRMTLVTRGSRCVIEQITKQLNKLVDVVKLVGPHRGPAHRARADADQGECHRRSARRGVKRLADIFRGRIIDVTDTTYTIELTGTGDKLDAFIQAGSAGIIEVVRSVPRASAAARRPCERLIINSTQRRKTREKLFYPVLAHCASLSYCGYSRLINFFRSES